MDFPTGVMRAEIESLRRRASGLVIELEGHANYCAPTDAAQALADEHYSQTQASLRFALNTLGARMLLYTEALGLRNASAVAAAWRARWPEDKLGTVDVWRSIDDSGLQSPALEELLPLVDGLLLLTGPDDAPLTDPVERRDREHLEHCLRSLAKLCRDRGVVPQREKDVQGVLHSALETVFPDYARNVHIPKPLMSFKPDGGVPSLKTAIECKFVASDAELTTAIHGLVEDLSGYSGSSDWIHFYSVVYMTEPFAVEGAFESALTASGHAGSWKTILVTGPGGRKRPERPHD